MLKKALKWYLYCVIIILLCAVAFRDLLAVISVAAGYSLLILLPGFVWVYPLRQSFLATFLLANIVGFAFGAAYAFLDIVLRIPLQAVTFIIIPVMAIGLGVWRWRKHYFPAPHTEAPVQ